MPDVFIYVNEGRKSNDRFCRELREAARRTVCNQPGAAIEPSHCWVRVVFTEGTDNITVLWAAHFKEGDRRTEEWEHAVTAALAPALGEVVEAHFPLQKIGISVDGDRIPFGPKNSFIETGHPAKR